MRIILPLLAVGLLLALVPLTALEAPTRVVDYLRPQEPRETVSLVAVGDIMLSRTVAERMRRYGPDYPFEQVAPLLREADIAFGNLETPITPGPEVIAYEMRFRADAEAAPALRRAGFNVLSLANNHILDFGPEGLENTLIALESEGIAHVGAGRNAVEAGRSAFVTVKGIRFAFLAYSYAAWASESRAGAAPMRIDGMTEAVREAEREADIVIVSMHAGVEYEPVPSGQQQSFARAAIDAGADMVIGHHPHVVQTMEVYNGKYIFYSLGNFVFDQMWSRATREGLVLTAIFSKNGLIDVSYRAVLTEQYAQPRFLEGEEAAAVFARLGWEEE